MSLRTYDKPGIPALDIKISWQFKHYDGCGDPTCDGPFKPGDWVRHDTAGGKGMIVAIDDSQITILWSIEPRSDIEMPPIRRVYPGLVANQLTQVQPMTLPSGLIFYLDYTYGANNELDKKCNEGPLSSRMYWKSRRFVKCYKERIQRSLSSLLSWSRLRFGKRLTAGSKTNGIDAETSQRLLEKWTKTGLRLPPSGQVASTHDSPPENFPLV